MKLKFNLNYCLLVILIIALLYYCLGNNLLEGYNYNLIGKGACKDTSEGNWGEGTAPNRRNYKHGIVGDTTLCKDLCDLLLHQI